MKTLRTTLLAGAALLGIGAALIHNGTVSAQTVSDGSASVACASAPGNWTDCTFTLARGISAGGSVAGSLPASDGTVALCDRVGWPHGDGAEDVPVCGISGNAAVFLCPNGCAAGTQFIAETLGARGSATALDFSVVGSVASVAPADVPAILGYGDAGA